MSGFRHVRSDFTPEWCAIAALAALDAAWAARIHFHLVLAWHDGLQLGLALVVTLALRLLARKAPWNKGGLIAEYFSLTVAATAVFVVLSYLCLASSGPLVDWALLAADRALGFDWLAGYRLLQAHPLAAKVLQLIYDSLIYQGLYFGILLGVMDRKPALREMFWLVLVAGLFTSAGAWLFPALGPYKTLIAPPPHSFIPEMEHLKSGRDLSFALAHLTGVVSFPSFHTTMSLAYIWGFRRTGPIGWSIAAINALMLCAIPFFGGHYLTDMIAGAGVMLVSLVIVKACAALWAGMARTAPHYAEVSAGI